MYDRHFLMSVLQMLLLLILFETQLYTLSLADIINSIYEVYDSLSFDIYIHL